MFAHGMRLLEAGLLGRGHVSAERVVDHAIRAGADRAWCVRCGTTMRGSPGMPAPVVVGRGPACDACCEAPVFDGFVRLGRYDSALGELVRRVKRQAWHRAGEVLGGRLAMEVRERFVEPPDGWCVVPVASAFFRRLARGIDHTHTLSSTMAATLRAPLVNALKLGMSSRQAGLDRGQRLARKPRMRLRTGSDQALRGRLVLLVDDVRTTGATLFEARELLINHGVRGVVAAVVCVSERHKPIP